MIKKTSKKLLLALIVPIGLLGTLYLLSPLLLNQVLHWQLAKLGIVSQTIIARPNHHSMLIKSAQLEIRTPEHNHNLLLKEISIQYRLLDLLLLQKIQSIKIGSLAVNVTKANLNSPSKTTPSNLNLGSLLPSAVFKKIPLQELQVEQLNIRYFLNQQNSISVQGKFQMTADEAALYFDYFENQKKKSVSVIKVHKNDQLHLKMTLLAPTLSATTATIMELTGSILKQGSDLDILIEQTLNLEGFATGSVLIGQNVVHYLEQLKHLKGIIKLNHRIKVPMQFQSAAKSLSRLSLESRFDIELEQQHLATVKGINADNAKLKSNGVINWKNQRLSVRLGPDSKIEFNQLNTSHISADFINIKLASAFSSSLDLKSARPLSTLVIDDLKLDIQTQQLNSQLGSINHALIKLNLSKIDWPAKRLSIGYKINDLAFTPNRQQTPLPFQELSANLEGEVQINLLSITASVNDTTQIMLANIQTEKLAVEQIKLVTQSQLKVAYTFNDKSLSIEPFSIALLPTRWQSPKGELVHKKISLAVSKFGYPNTEVKVSFNIKEAIFNAKNLPFKSLKTRANGSIEIAKQQVYLEIDETLQLELYGIRTPQLRTKELTLNTSNSIKVELPLTDLSEKSLLEMAKIAPFNVAITGSALHLGKQQVAYQRLSVNLNKVQLSPLHIIATSKLRHLTLATNPLLKNINISARHSLIQQRYRGQLNVSSKRLPLSITAKLEASNNFKKINGHWILSDIALDEHAQDVVQTLDLPWPATLKVLSGSYSQTGDFKMRKGDIKAEVNHKITLLNLAQEDILLDDINIVSQNIYNNKKLSQSGRISIGKVQSTIPINNISASFNLSNLLAANRSFTLRDLKANILEAKVSLKQLNSPFAVLQGNSVLVFSELPLNNVLALEQQPSLTGKGTLAGKLPFRFDGQQLWINDGKITSTDNGYIRYSANAKVKALAASNAGLEIALKVLENFQYKLLSIGVSYQPSGDLLLKNKLSGNNPDWQRGQPIDFSINIEENVLQLLKTLQFSNNLNDKIQDKIQQSQ